MKFASKPSSYTKIENIEPEWLLHCEEKDFKKLIRLELVNKKVKDSFEKDWNAEELRKRFLKYA